MPSPRRTAVASCLLTLACLLPPAIPLGAEEPVHWEVIHRLRHEGFHDSEAMKLLEELTHEIGPRLTGSPAMRRANEWTRDKLAGWGLANAHLEGFEFGRGWSFSRTAVHMVAPRSMPLIALPKAWTPGTEGAVRGVAMRVAIESEEDLEEHRGELEGKILLLDEARQLRDSTEPEFTRYDAAGLEEVSTFEIPGDADRRDRWRKRFAKRWKLRRAMHEFLVEEGVLATLEVSSRDGGMLRLGGGGSRHPEESVGVPSLVVAAEQYNHLVRLLERGQEVALEIEVEARFHDGDGQAYNTVAEIPGTDLAEEVVLLGGHLDSWHAGTGATDNGAGVVIAMEAVRLLKELELRPRRTVRIVLWGGEEQGLLGSRAYVAEHYASRPEPEDPEERRKPSFLRQERGPLTVKPDHAEVAAYFNLDNGGGRIRGIWAQENVAAKPIFEAWLRPFHDLGADTVTLNNTRGTDHLSFVGVGLPGFQFVQDPLDYFAHTHHTQADTLDHIVAEDLKQAAVVMASFVYHAAMRDELLPRPPMPEDGENEEDDEDDDAAQEG